jgi:predicted outer membrane lipoprotein
MALRGTLTHRKTRRLAKLLDIPLPCALGVMEALWHVTAEQVSDGGIGRMSDLDIAEEMFWEGDPEQLITALLEAQLLDRHPEFRLVVHSWFEHADDAVHMSLARRGLRFATGEAPRMSRLSRADREKAERTHGKRTDAPDERGPAHNGAQCAHSVRTLCAPPEPEPKPEPERGDRFSIEEPAAPEPVAAAPAPPSPSQTPPPAADYFRARQYVDDHRGWFNLAVGRMSERQASQLAEGLESLLAAGDLPEAAREFALADARRACNRSGTVSPAALLTGFELWRKQHPPAPSYTPGGMDDPRPRGVTTADLEQNPEFVAWRQKCIEQGHYRQRHLA